MDYRVVTGIVKKIGLVEVPSKVRGKDSRIETKIRVNVLIDNEVSKNHEETFAGGKELTELFKVGDKVKIVCTTKTGSHIRDIKLIE